MKKESSSVSPSCWGLGTGRTCQQVIQRLGQRIRRREPRAEPNPRPAVRLLRCDQHRLHILADLQRGAHRSVPHCADDVAYQAPDHQQECTRPSAIICLQAHLALDSRNFCLPTGTICKPSVATVHARAQQPAPPDRCCRPADICASKAKHMMCNTMHAR